MNALPEGVTPTGRVLVPGSHRLSVVLTAVLCTAACGPPLLKLPAGPGAAAPDIADVAQEATASCRSVNTLSAELTVRGSVGGRRIPRIRLLAGLVSPDSSYLEAVASFGEALFIYAARENRATLLLPRDERALSDGDPRAVLEAVTGIPLGAGELQATITGCTVDEARTGANLGRDWRRTSIGSVDIYFRRETAKAGWRVVAMVHRGESVEWRAEYRDFNTGLPTMIRLVSLESNRFDLQLSLSGVEINQPIDPSVFDIEPSASMSPISLDELRRGGPLASR